MFSTYDEWKTDFNLGIWLSEKKAEEVAVVAAIDASPRNIFHTFLNLRWVIYLRVRNFSSPPLFHFENYYLSDMNARIYLQRISKQYANEQQTLQCNGNGSSQIRCHQLAGQMSKPKISNAPKRSQHKKATNHS